MIVFRRIEAVALSLAAALVFGCGRTSLYGPWDGGPSGTSPTLGADGAALQDGSSEPPSSTDASGLPPGTDGGQPLPPADLSYPPLKPTDAPNFRIDATHTGAQPLETIAPPLTVAWTIDVGLPVTYPTVANGTVFVTAGRWSLDLKPGSVTAVDLATGAPLWGPLALGNDPLAAYDRGALFVVNFNGQLISVDAATGKTNWAVKITAPDLLSSPPVALDGVVYIAGTWAIAEATGSVLWHAPYYGTDGAVAVQDGIVFGGESAGQASAVDAATGQELWHHTTGQGGGGGSTPSVFDGRLYVRTMFWRNSPWHDQIFDTLSGTLLATFTSFQSPAFATGVGYYLDDSGTLSAVSLSTDTPAWTFVGDGALTTAAIVAGAYVYVGSKNGNLYALDQGGNVVWTTTVAGAINSDQQIESMVVAEGTVLVPVGNQLVAFRP